MECLVAGQVRFRDRGPESLGRGGGNRIRQCACSASGGSLKRPQTVGLPSVPGGCRGRVDAPTSCRNQKCGPGGSGHGWHDPMVCSVCATGKRALLCRVPTSAAGEVFGFCGGAFLSLGPGCI